MCENRWNNADRKSSPKEDWARLALGWQSAAAVKSKKYKNKERLLLIRMHDGSVTYEQFGRRPMREFRAGGGGDIYGHPCCRSGTTL